MHVFAQDLALALMIGAEVFAIAALWPLSEWAVKAPRHWGFALALLVIVACVALDSHGVAFPPVVRGPAPCVLDRRPCAGLGAAAAVPRVPRRDLRGLGAVAHARRHAPARYARATALCVAAVAVIVAPFASIVAGCGLAGACF